jgi:hypothetical protein
MVRMIELLSRMVCMRYNPPIDSKGKPYYVPVATKNRDYLIGYLNGIETAKELIKDVMESINIDVDLGPIDVVLDSTRYNDILENGKRESEMTEDELKEYILDIVQDVTCKIDSTSEENNIDNDSILSLECTCGYGFYSWKKFEDIPYETFRCSNCGNVIIDYTNVNDYEFEYDGGKDE